MFDQTRNDYSLVDILQGFDPYRRWKTIDKSTLE